MSEIYYNENNKNLVKWLKELSKRNLITPGDIDDRPIQEVKTDEIKKYKQVHLFAGIGGWSYTLKLAGWNEKQSVWTGSCPCQPFSKSGVLKRFSDERHLWPEMFRLISEARPEIIFGEQVPNLWWADIVANNLERSNYSFWAEIRRASGVGANHERRRLFGLLPTPIASDNRNRGSVGKDPTIQKRFSLGKQIALSMLFDGKPCPMCVRSMMGYPEEWDKSLVAAMATQ